MEVMIDEDAEAKATEKLSGSNSVNKDKNKEDKSTDTEAVSESQARVQQLSITASEQADPTAKMTPADLKQVERKRKDAIEKQKREQMRELDEKNRRERKERVEALSKKLLDKLNIWTESSKDESTTKAFREQVRLEAESLKMESFGVELLHTIGRTYANKGTTFRKTHESFLGISGLFSKFKEKKTFAKDVWTVVSSALDAQSSMNEIREAEQKGGDSWEQSKVTLETALLGKVLAAAWNGSKMEVTQIVSEVCDKILNDKSISLEKRMECAEGLILIGHVFKSTRRSEEEQAEVQIFEQLVADAAMSKKKAKERQKAEADFKAAADKIRTESTAS